jgi:hypothetical protein
MQKKLLFGVGPVVFDLARFLCGCAGEGAAAIAFAGQGRVVAGELRSCLIVGRRCPLKRDFSLDGGCALAGARACESGRPLPLEEDCTLAGARRRAP